jgi:hypothetical protein
MIQTIKYEENELNNMQEANDFQVNKKLIISEMRTSASFSL